MKETQVLVANLGILIGQIKRTNQRSEPKLKYQVGPQRSYSHCGAIYMHTCKFLRFNGRLHLSHEAETFLQRVPV